MFGVSCDENPDYHVIQTTVTCDQITLVNIASVQSLRGVAITTNCMLLINHVDICI